MIANIVIIILLASILGVVLTRKTPDMNTGRILQSISTYSDTVKSMCETVTRKYDTIPSSVVAAVTGSSNPRKGKLGELITLMNLTGKYTMLIPLGQPVDFIGISNDSIDFIEVKTGKSRLTDNEKKIRELIMNNMVRFVEVRTDVITNCIQEES